LEQEGINANWTMAAAAAEYRESLELEKRLAEDAAVAGQWLTHQMAAADAEQLALASANMDSDAGSAITC
jgi:hypothetical protein